MVINKRLLAAPILLLATLLNMSSADAAPNPVPTGITVSPAFQQVSIQAGELEHPISFSITNNQSVPQTLNLSSADFNTLNESGGLLFVGTIPTEIQKRYGLAQWLSLPQNQITIAPKQTAVINANILNLSTMPAGGHYGALMISATGAQPAKNKIALQPIASSLLFVTKIGGDTHKLILSNVYFNHSIIKLPGSVTLRFRNNGNTHLIPRGEITITNSKDKIISKGIINENSGIILPETYRQYHVSLQQVAGSKMIGTYKLRVDFRFEGLNQFRGYGRSFIYVPAIYFVAVTLVIVLGTLVTYRYLRRRSQPASQKRST